MKALILAGGLGERLRPHTEKIPKPLIEIGGKPILEWQITWLKRFGIKKFVLAVGYLGEKIEEYFKDGKNFDVHIEYSYEHKKLGTGGAIKNAKKFLESENGFFVINGDVITDLDPIKLIQKLDNGIGAIAVVPLPSPYGIIDFEDASGKIRRFVEKPLLPEYWINAGVYFLKRDIFDYLPDEGDIEKTAFPKLAEKGLLFAIPYRDVIWKSVDTHKDIKEAKKILEKANYL